MHKLVVFIMLVVIIVLSVVFHMKKERFNEISIGDTRKTNVTPEPPSTIGMVPDDAQQTCFNYIQDTIKVGGASANDLTQNKYNEHVLKYGLKPGLTKISDVYSVTMRAADSDGTCVITPDLLVPYGVDNQCVLRDKKSGKIFNLPQAKHKGVTPEGCVVDFKQGNWQDILTALYNNEHSDILQDIHQNHVQKEQATNALESVQNAYNVVNSELIRVQTIAQQQASANESLKGQISEIKQTIFSQMMSGGGLIKFARYVKLERFDNRTVAISIRDMEVYDMQGKRISGKTSTSPRQVMIDLQEDMDISRVIIKNRYDTQDSIIGTRLSVITNSNSVVYSQDITTAQDEYIFNMTTGANNATAIQELMQSSGNIPVNGVYNIFCNGADKPTYCIMNRDYDGGGWMLLMKMKHGDTFDFQSKHWTQATELNSADNNLLVRDDAKFPVFNHVGMKDIMVIFLTDNKIGGHLSPSRQTTEGARGWVWICNNWFNRGERVNGLVGFGVSRLAPISNAMDFDRQGIEERLWSSQQFNGQVNGRVVFGGHAAIQENGRGLASANDWGSVRFGMVFNENETNDFMSTDAWCGIGGGGSDATATWNPQGPFGTFSAGDYFYCCGSVGMHGKVKALVFGR
jgi:hypothetical protein